MQRVKTFDASRPPRHAFLRRFGRWTGPTEETAFIAGASLLSLITYLLASDYIRYELPQFRYRNFVLREYFGRFDFPDLLPVGMASIQSALPFCSYLLLITVIAFVIVRLRSNSQDTGPELIAYALGLAVIPPLFMSTLFWSDGAGKLTTTMLIGASTMLGAMTTACGVAFFGWRPRRGAARASMNVSLQHHRWQIMFVLLLPPLLLAAWWCGVSAIQGYDSWSYHLPLAARWLVDSKLSRRPEVSLTDFFPGNFEWLVRWTLALGSPRYGFIVSFAAGAGCLYVIYKICLELGQTRAASTISAACAATCVVFTNQMTGTYSDNFATFATMLGVLFLFRWLRTGSTHLLLPLGLSVGVAAGSKYTALAPILIILIVFGWNLLTVARPRRALVRDVAAVLVPAILCAGYWYLRNAVENGNPVFPISMFGLRGVTMEYFVGQKAGMPESSVSALALPWREFGFGPGYQDDGLGLVYTALALPAFLILPVFENFLDRKPTVTLWLMTAAMYAYWFSTGSFYARFGLIPIMLTFVFIGETWQYYGSRLFRILALMSYTISVALLFYQLSAIAAYSQLLPPEMKGVPSVVDKLPAAQILNAASLELTLPLMGRDYRHHVVTYFRDATPRDVIVSRANYVLLKESQRRAFTSQLQLAAVASDSSLTYGRLTLWRVGRH